MSVLSGGISLRAGQEHFLAPGLGSLANLIKNQLVYYKLDQDFTRENLVEWLLQQSILDFGSNKGRFFTQSLNNMGNHRVDAIFFNEGVVHHRENQGLKTWSEVEADSKRIALGVMAGSALDSLPGDLVNMQIHNYDEFLTTLFDKLTDNGFAVVDTRCLDSMALVYSINYYDLVFRRVAELMIISKINQSEIFSELASEL